MRSGFSRQRQHLRGSVSGQDGSGWSDTPCYRERLLPGTSAHVEDSMTDANFGQVEHGQGPGRCGVRSVTSPPSTRACMR